MDDLLDEKTPKPSNGKKGVDPGQLLTGAHVTLQDYINKIEEHNVFLQYVIKNGLVSLEANLKTGQHELKEQIFVSTDALAQQLEGISVGLAAQSKNQEAAKTGKDVSGRQVRNDDKGKTREA